LRFCARLGLRPYTDTHIKTLHDPEEMMPPPSVKTGTHLALCVSTMRRTWQVKLALAQNVLASWPLRNYCTWYLADLNDHSTSQADHDELWLWLQEFCAVPMMLGHIRYFRVRGTNEFWHASVGKNTSHGLPAICGAPMGTTSVVNVDCDNIVSREWIRQALIKACDSDQFPAMVWWAGLNIGCTGRIQVPLAVFDKLGGYNEGLPPMGGQDVDLAMRARDIGKQWQKGKITNECTGYSVSNRQGGCNHGGSCEEKMRNVSPEFMSGYSAKKNWDTLNKMTLKTSKEDREAGRLIANEGKRRGLETDELCIVPRTGGRSWDNQGWGPVGRESCG